ncbi:MAG: hypothetical protein NW241_10270 [Bacteroidia bacterium]|nr:hypothetical protein [Bacteroidia bacterium]
MRFHAVFILLVFSAWGLHAQESAQWQLRTGLHAHVRPLIENLELAGHRGLNISGVWLRRGLQAELGLSVIQTPRRGLQLTDEIGTPMGRPFLRYWELRLAPALLYRVRAGAFVAAAGLQARISPWQAVRTGILPPIFPVVEDFSRWYPVRYYRALGAAVPVEAGFQAGRFGMLLRYEQGLINRLAGAGAYPERASHLQLSATWQLR